MEIHILLVEDNEDDIAFTCKALASGKIRNRISVVRDGEEALQFLRKQEKFVDAEKPDLILLDLNLPKIDGIEVLTEIKNENDLKSIPIVMLTTSSVEKHITAAYKNHANCFITKPVDLNKFLQIITDIEDYWISIVRLPKS
ncbi:response regulator [Chryseotalea sanaruensis]|uniref:Response regulator n=1 Tax=Chryseotalea sanaruensis TaxID=2482724 RepID=A0A401UEI8_9BACT|nr:response regulator [Chryseotalea sanaruensis]GCC53264.1 response regulator [Chryseotalea sanaruensis]